MIQLFAPGTDGMERIDEVQPGCWVNVVDPTKEELFWLTNDLGIVDEFIDSAFDPEETSHIDTDEDENQTLIIVDYPAIEDAADTVNPEIIQYDTQPLSAIFLHDEDIMVTASPNPCETVKSFVRGTKRNISTESHTRLFLQMLMDISMRYIRSLRTLKRQYAKTEKQLRKSQKNVDLMKMLGLEKSLLYLSTSLAGNQTTLGIIQGGRVISLREDDRDMLEDVLIETQQAAEMSQIYLSVLTRTMDTFSNIISNNLNTVIRRLTVITIVLAIPTIIFSFYGMNTSWLPFSEWWIFPVVLALVATVAIWLLLSRSKSFQ